jgi:predicted 3-demethylubiquinone-9 3-methyltransferase (glyoxalase superfamily)
MQTITPFLWFTDQAEEAVNFYVSLFRNSKAGNLTRYEEASAKVSGRPEESVMTIEFQLEGQDFIALNGGPEFTFSPAVSFFVSCETPEEIDKLWQKLSTGGTVLMELDKYPFSEKYGWLQDRYGVSWQFILADRAQKITPCLLFVGKQYGKAEEAMHLYTSLFKNSGIRYLERYGAGEGSSEGTVKHATFSLNGQEFIAMDSGLEHHFTFTPAISLMVSCKTQEEVDGLWNKLSEGGEKEAQQCGWLKDQYGVSWQIVPTVLNALLSNPDPEKSKRVMKAMLQMKKLDIEALKQAAEQSYSRS